MNKEIIKKLYDYLEMNVESCEDDYNNDYLTKNTGRDGNVYYYYYDGNKIGAINTETLEIIDDEEKIEELF